MEINFWPDHKKKLPACAFASSIQNGAAKTPDHSRLLASIIYTKQHCQCAHDSLRHLIPNVTNRRQQRYTEREEGTYKSYKRYVIQKIIGVGRISHSSNEKKTNKGIDSSPGQCRSKVATIFCINVPSKQFQFPTVVLQQQIIKA